MYFNDIEILQMRINEIAQQLEKINRELEMLKLLEQMPQYNTPLTTGGNVENCYIRFRQYPMGED